MVKLGNDWEEILADEFKKDYYLQLREFLKKEYSAYTIYPNMYVIVNALIYTSFAQTKVVIIGQDPYHGPGQAHGLCFSVKEGVQPPPSLMNIFKEIEDDLGITMSGGVVLRKWAGQGVLLLNTVLTVRRGSPNSHKGMGWERFTDRVISELNNKTSPVIFLLWGANAKNKAPLITNPIHHKLSAPHPSPLSAYNGFFGCKHFSQCNKLLEQEGLAPIDWRL